MELNKRIPPKMEQADVYRELTSIGLLIRKLADVDIFPWLDNPHQPQQDEVHRAATVVADRLCGAVADPIIRNAQERRQLSSIRKWLEKKEYVYIKTSLISDVRKMQAGTFTFHLNVPVFLEGGRSKINIPVDVAVMPRKKGKKQIPVLIECKSAGDFTDTNKRRKEEATKIAQLRANYGNEVAYILFLCGYFDSGYLGYEAAEGLDWVWEHRMEDLAKFKL